MSAPAGVSALVLALGIWFAYGRWIDPFEGSLTAMVLLQTTLSLPFAYRMLWAVDRGAQTRLVEAARTLGARPAQAFWWVEWPRWRPVVLGLLAMTGAASLGEVAAASFFASDQLVPLPLLATRWMARYQFEQAQWVSIFLLALSALAVAGVVFGVGSSVSQEDHRSV
jgi:ABC-type Fe3+ transport system permease subunit